MPTGHLLCQAIVTILTKPNPFPSHNTWSYFRGTIEQYMYDLKVKGSKKMVPYQSSPLESLDIPSNLRLQSSSEEFSRSARVLEDQRHIRYPIFYQFEMDEEDGIYTSVIMMLIP